MIEEFAREYFKLLSHDYKGINLTRILDWHDFYQKQIMDAIVPSQQSHLFAKTISDNEVVVDVGFGGGVPILPLAYVFPNVQFVGLEARRKKVDVVSDIAHRLGLANVKLCHYRLEDVVIDRRCTLTFKAVGEIGKMCSLLRYTEKIWVYFYKGPRFDLKEDLNTLRGNWTIVERTKYSIEGTTGRELIGISPKKVPRGTSKKDKNVVKLSEII